MKKILSLCMTVVLAVCCTVTAGAATAPRTFHGYPVTIADHTTPAADMRGRLNDATAMLFVSADGKELASIAYRDYTAIIQTNATVVRYADGSTLYAPPEGYDNWHRWLCAEFNDLRGLGRTVPAVPAEPGGSAGSSAAISKADAQRFYAGYDLQVYDWNKTAVLFGSYAVAGRYSVQVFYAADGHIIGSMDSANWPQVDAQLQVDYFNAYRGLPSAKLRFDIPFVSMDDSGVEQYSLKTPIMTDEEIQQAIREAFRLTNEERERLGKEPLVMDDSLMDFAAVRAQELSVSFSHTRPNGKNAALGGGEIIYWGSADANRAITAWINSEGHHRIMTGSAYTKVGIGLYQDEDGRCYWVQQFRRPSLAERMG